MKDIWSKIALPIFLLVVFVLAIIGLYNMVKGFSNVPQLALKNPAQTTTTSDKVVVSGQADPHSNVTVNGKAVVLDAVGNFNYTYKLNDGKNSIKVVAQKSLTTKNNTKTFIVTRNEPVVQNAAQSTVKSITGVSSTSSVSELSTSGPVDSFWGAFGITAILASLFMLRKSKSDKFKGYSFKVFT
jgi:hypothetical protein